MCVRTYVGVPVFNLMGESASVPVKEAQCRVTHFGGHLWKERKRPSQGSPVMLLGILYVLLYCYCTYSIGMLTCRTSASWCVEYVMAAVVSLDTSYLLLASVNSNFVVA